MPRNFRRLEGLQAQQHAQALRPSRAAAGPAACGRACVEPSMDRIVLQGVEAQCKNRELVLPQVPGRFGQLEALQAQQQVSELVPA